MGEFLARFFPVFEEVSMKEELNQGDIDQIGKMASLSPYTEKCRHCTWSQYCIAPPTLTEEDIQEASKVNEGDDPMVGMMTALSLAGRDQSLPGCKVFIERVMHDEKFVKDIKRMMRGELVFVEKSELNEQEKENGSH